MDGLLCTQAQADAINAMLPSDIRVQPIAGADGQTYLGADLLSDIGPGGTYHAAAAQIASLVPATFTPVGPSGGV